MFRSVLDEQLSKAQDLVKAEEKRLKDAEAEIAPLKQAYEDAVAGLKPKRDAIKAAGDEVTNIEKAIRAYEGVTTTRGPTDAIVGRVKTAKDLITKRGALSLDDLQTVIKAPSKDSLRRSLAMYGEEHGLMRDGDVFSLA